MAAICALLDRDSCALRRLHRRLVSGNPTEQDPPDVRLPANRHKRPGSCCDKWGRYMAMLEQSWSTENLQPDKTLTSSHKRALLRRVTETIRERCHESDLDPARVAAALGLARRFRERFGATPSAYRLNTAN
jgi:hypothetical protein